MERREAAENLDSIIRGHVEGANRDIALDSLRILTADSTPERVNQKLMMFYETKFEHGIWYGRSTPTATWEKLTTAEAVAAERERCAGIVRKAMPDAHIKYPDMLHAIEHPEKE